MIYTTLVPLKRNIFIATMLTLRRTALGFSEIVDFTRWAAILLKSLLCMMRVFLLYGHLEILEPVACSFLFLCILICNWARSSQNWLIPLSLCIFHKATNKFWIYCYMSHQTEWCWIILQSWKAIAWHPMTSSHFSNMWQIHHNVKKICLLTITY